MHTFLAILEDHEIVYVDVPDWTGPQDQFPGWSQIVRKAVVEQALMSEEDARRASFVAGVRPPSPSSHFR